jgi:hypothetical protein
MEFLVYKLEYQCTLEEREYPSQWQFAPWPELKLSIKETALPAPDSKGYGDWVCSWRFSEIRYMIERTERVSPDTIKLWHIGFFEDKEVKYQAGSLMRCE